MEDRIEFSEFIEWIAFQRIKDNPDAKPDNPFGGDDAAAQLWNTLNGPA